MLTMCYVINWHGKGALKVRFYNKYVQKLRLEIAKGRDDL